MDHEVVRRAERHAGQVIKDAQAKSDQIIHEAEAYALEQLKQLKKMLNPAHSHPSSKEKMVCLLSQI